MFNPLRRLAKALNQRFDSSPSLAPPPPITQSQPATSASTTPGSAAPNPQSAESQGPEPAQSVRTISIPLSALTPLITGDVDDASLSICELYQLIECQNPVLGHIDYYNATGEPFHLRTDLPKKLSARAQLGSRLAAYWYVDTFQLVGDLIRADHRQCARLAELVSILMESNSDFAQQVATSIQPMPFAEESFTTPESRMAALRGEIICSLAIIADNDSRDSLAADLKHLIAYGEYPHYPDLVIQFIQYLCWLDEPSETAVLCNPNSVEDDTPTYYYYLGDDD